MAQSLVSPGREVNADDLALKSSPSKEITILLSMTDAISHS